ncbi:MAG: hypothetical protein ABFS12_06980 [Bacteroidota bacterium]
MQRRIHYSIALLSVSIIAFQIALIQILSILQWYHFAYMAISIALLGFGASGTFLALFKEKLINISDHILPILMITSSISMALVVRISQIDLIKFDTYLLFSESSQIWKLLLTYILFIIPFFLSALAIGIIYVKFSESISILYFFSLVGSGVGGILIIGLMWIFFPSEIPTFIAIIPFISGLLLIQKKNWIVAIPFIFVALVILLFSLNYPQKLLPSQFKSFSKTMNLPEAKVIEEKNSPYGFVQLVNSPALRFAPGLSLKYTDTLHSVSAIFNNGDWYGPVLNPNSSNQFRFMDFTTQALPYYAWENESALILQSGTNYRAYYSVLKGIKDVTAVEPNHTVVPLIENLIQNTVNLESCYGNVTVINQSTRTFLQSNTVNYDLITFATIGSFGGSSGLYALQEEYDITKEAFFDAWNILNDDGLLSLTCWMDYPPRKPLKVLATLVEMMEESGIDNPSKHICAIRSWSTITFVVKKSKLIPKESTLIRNFCNDLSFDIVLLPDLENSERNKYNILHDENFFQYIDKILSKDREIFYQNYTFNIKPAEDNRPYFSQFLKFSHLKSLKDNFNLQAIPYFELGYIIVILTFLQIVIAALILIILPLFKLGWKGEKKSWTVLYFMGIGLGYMFVEIVFVHRFILYLGNPIYSATVVISAMLISSGIGSYYSDRINYVKKNIKHIFTLIIALLILYPFFLSPLLDLTISYSEPLKFSLSFLIIAPLSFFMGIPFPSGIKYLSRTQTKNIPWAIGINGCFSVFGTVLATIISAELGFTWVIVLAAFAYCISLLTEIVHRLS